MVRFYTKQPTFIASRGWMRLEVPTEKDVFFLAIFFLGGGKKRNIYAVWAVLRYLLQN